MTETATFLDWLSAALLVSGAFFTLVAGVGLLLLPDLLARMHASAKPQVLGLMLMLAGLAIAWESWPWVPVLFLAWVTQMVTAPVAAHQGLHIGQSHAFPLNVRIPSSAEGLEEFRQIFFGNPPPVVSDMEEHVLASALPRDIDPSGPFRIHQ